MLYDPEIKAMAGRCWRLRRDRPETKAKAWYIRYDLWCRLWLELDVYQQGKPVVVGPSGGPMFFGFEMRYHA